MMQIKKGFLIFLAIITFGFNLHIYDSILVKAAEKAEITIQVADQKSIIEEPHTIYITIEEEEPRIIELFIEEEEKKKQEKEQPIIPEKSTSINQYSVIINSLSTQDKELICRITYLEAGNQCIEGQRAVIEVILNRMIGAKWPNTIEGVLSAPRQFSTWKNRNNVSNEQITQMSNVLNIVNCSANTILPNSNYVYFNNKNGSNNSIKIQGHWFWT